MKGLLMAAAIAAVASGASARAGFGALLPTGQTLTPQAAPGALFQALDPELPGLPDFRAGQASAVSLSPDGRTLLIVDDAPPNDGIYTVPASTQVSPGAKHVTEVLAEPAGDTVVDAGTA